MVPVQESVISPRYLFQHPMYRVHPRQQQHYQEVRHVQGSQTPLHPLSFERSSGRATRILAANSNSVLAPSSNSNYKRSVENFERDLKSELQNFNEAVTKLGRGTSDDEEEADCSENSSN